MVAPIVVWGAGALLGYLVLSKKKRGAMMPPPGAPGATQPPAVQPPPGPPSGVDQQEAERLAPVVAADIVAKGRGTNRVVDGILIQGTGYNQMLLKQFQRLARLTIDGLYGPKSAGALSYYLKRDAPPSIYSDAQGRRTPVSYSPNAQ